MKSWELPSIWLSRHKPVLRIMIFASFVYYPILSFFPLKLFQLYPDFFCFFAFPSYVSITANTSIFLALPNDRIPRSPISFLSSFLLYSRLSILAPFFLLFPFLVRTSGVAGYGIGSSHRTKGVKRKQKPKTSETRHAYKQAFFFSLSLYIYKKPILVHRFKYWVRKERR